MDIDDFHVRFAAVSIGRQVAVLQRKRSMNLVDYPAKHPKHFTLAGSSDRTISQWPEQALGGRCAALADNGAPA